MADEPKPFDKVPIVGIVNLKGRSFGVREIVISVVAVLLLLLCCIFIGLYAKEVHDNDRDSVSRLEEDYCTTKECMETAAYSLKLMKSSVDPCDNFYEYACGNYKTYPSGFILETMYDTNDEDVLNILEKPQSEHTSRSYEKKLSTFYRSCVDEISRDNLLGEPFLKHVVSELGGWDLLGTSKVKFDFQTLLKQVQFNFGEDAFFQLSVPIPFPRDDLLSIKPPGRLRDMSILYPDRDEFRKKYNIYIKRIATLLMRDAKVDNITSEEKEARIDGLVKDVLTIEEMMLDSLDDNPAREKKSEITVNTLIRDTNYLIDWKDQLNYMYHSDRIEGDTRVGVSSVNFFKRVTDIIRNLGLSRDRILKNYLIWRCADKYAKDLSHEYVEAFDDLYSNLVDHTGLHYKKVQNRCMDQSNLYLKEAVGALYIHERLDRLSKDKAVKITKNLRRALMSELDENPWMDEETKRYAKAKVSETTLKVGYPDWMANDDQVDAMYDVLIVNRTDFFKNVLNANKFLRERNIESFAHLLTKPEWKDSIASINIHYELYKNELTVSAGILQDPIYNREAPHFKTFGSFGAMFGQYLIHAVDEHDGQYFSKSGQYLDDKSWWSNRSIEAYKIIDTCVKDVYSTVDLPDYHLSLYIATTNGVRLALKGYHDWIKALGIKEKMPPGLGLSDDQMIFLSFAQSHCNTWKNNDDETYVNMALGQLEEFSDAFQCKDDAEMNRHKKCSYF